MQSDVHMDVYIVIGRINMIDSILKALQSNEVMYVTSLLSSAFMFIVMLGAMLIHIWILFIMLLDYKKMK